MDGGREELVLKGCTYERFSRKTYSALTPSPSIASQEGFIFIPSGGKFLHWVV